MKPPVPFLDYIVIYCCGFATFGVPVFLVYFMRARKDRGTEDLKQHTWGALKTFTGLLKSNFRAVSSSLGYKYSRTVKMSRTLEWCTIVIEGVQLTALSFTGLVGGGC